jgi:hypothetical protein
MVRINIFSSRERGPVAIVEADDHRGYRIDGACAELVDPAEPTLGLPSGRSVTAEEAPEEWARGLILRFRSPDLTARIVHDDHPVLAQAEPMAAGAQAYG